MKKGRAGTMTHDYKRHGTTTLFAALNVLDGTVIGRNMQRHRHQEFIRFLNTIDAEVPAGKVVPVALLPGDQPVAVVLDFVHPLGPGGRPRSQGRDAGLDQTGPLPGRGGAEQHAINMGSASIAF
jgi:hypothetical protein